MTTSVTTVVRSRQAGWSIAFVDCDPVLHGLETILHGWDLVRLPKNRATRADVTITSTANGYDWASETLPKPKYWDESPPLTARDAVSDIHDALFDWYQLAHPKRLCLHAGAVRVGSQLVCFPAVGKAGKSSLSIELAAAGHTFFCDDVLAIDGETLAGIALGVAPVMRRPFPHSPGARITAYAKAHLGLSNAKWAYVPPDPAHWAAHGTTAPVGAIVLLDRRPSGAVRLERLSAADALRELVLQSFGCRGDRAHALATLHAVLNHAEIFRLRYSNLREAADDIATARALPTA
mgnify:FL=1